MCFHEIGFFCNPFSQAVKERSLQSAKAVVKSGDVWLGEGVSLRVALTCQAVDDGTARIAQPHDLRTLVYSLAGSVVNGLSQHFHVVIGIYLHYL